MTPKLKPAASAATTTRQPVVTALRSVAAVLLAAAGLPALAQVCDPADPPFLAEGPIAAVSSNGGDGTVGGSMTSMGVTFEVLPNANVHTPTATLDMNAFASTQPFPGRTQAGFLGATVQATGCVKTGPNGPIAYADDVFSDVSEHVVLGVVTTAFSGGTFGVNGTTTKLLTDPRMPADPIMNAFGFELAPESLAVGVNASVEGYYANDGSGELHVWAVEVDGGTLADPGTHQISIQRFDCGSDLEIRGAIYLTTPSCSFGAPYSLALFGDGQQIPLNTNRDVSVTNGVAPNSAFCTYRLRPDLPPGGQCPASIKVELRSNGTSVAEATAP